MSLKATELRIGNLVVENEHACNSVVDRVKFISGIGGDVSFKDGSTQNYIAISPIPLTEDWLLKFRFDKALNGWWDESENFSVSNNLLAFRLGVDFLTELKHVHQLQNLYYALTNKELTIKQ